MEKIKIGTRGSKLALWQANQLQSALHAASIDNEIIIIKTKGDQIQHLSFDKIEGKGFFTKEIEDALLADQIDVAVHSLKDLPTEMPSGLALCGLNERANPADILIYHPEAADTSRTLGIKSGATVGTSSIRRKVQIHDFDSDIQLVDIRGNVPTRINKVKTGEVDAIVLASAGVDRLEIDLEDLMYYRFNPVEFIPAPAQGVVGYQCRVSDQVTKAIMADIHNRDTALCTNVERTVLKLMDGGCQVPLGTYVYRDDAGNYHGYGMLGAGVGDPITRAKVSQSTHAGLADAIVAQLKQA